MPGKNLVLKLYNLRTRFFPGMQFSQYARKQLSDNDISVFFNHQYFINRLDERKKIHEQVFRKNSCLGKWIILGAKMAYPHNSGLALRLFFLNFAQ